MQSSDMLKPREEPARHLTMYLTLKQKWQLGEPWTEYQEVQRVGNLLWLVHLDGPTLPNDEKLEE